MYPNYEYDDDLKALWRNLVVYFDDNGNHPWDPKQGLLFIGAIGCGKTTIFKILQKSLIGRKNGFDSVPTWQLTNEYQSIGGKYIDKYLYNEEILKVYNKKLQ